MRTSVPGFARNDMTDMTSLALIDRPFAIQTISLANRAAVTASLADPCPFNPDRPPT